ncbi:GNAT family N-acetyltransferase [Cystobacter fuscus]|uniref:GNAT family N-acetyltransferase n=1 Tax=Cystobacter fuscus TaxID=43 RepID=UPI002B2D72B0|nr:GNAT family N-acetyltransferase [Cystobacter fuscus]
MTVLFRAADLLAERVADADVECLQPLLEHCEDYHQVVYGRPATEDEARRMPSERPPGLTPEQPHLMALRDTHGRSVGVLEGLRDYPSPGEWYLGLLLLSPEVRGQGRGEAVLRAYVDWVRAEGGRLLRLAAVEQNEAGRRFWARMGFREEKWVGPLEQGLRMNRLVRMTMTLG